MAAKRERHQMSMTAVVGERRGSLVSTTTVVAMVTRTEGPFTLGQLDQLADALGLDPQFLLDHVRATISAFPINHPENRP
jgi:hypothetical protein